MNEHDFLNMIISGSENNKELEGKVRSQGYVYIKTFFRIIKVHLMKIIIFPYGEFEVGNWNGKKFKHRTTLYWKDNGKTWAVTKEELLCKNSN